MYGRGVTSYELSDRKLYLIDMYNYIHGYKPSIYPWQWDYEYDDDMMGIFYVEDLAALKAIERLVQAGIRNNEQKMHSAKVAKEESQNQGQKRPRFNFVGK
jgi:hypothetical protein